ncbi:MULTISPECIES: hypothetical protein [Rhizobium/Agrobacterium group]|uniref:hypothetical protein n=1 Tax=Rhizobium/Agrobacterium group TaxID=227290 RepID=UPI0015748169|nr:MULTISPECIES: hypothetical protein [Rhizobium/Agrobacterium group]MBD8653341.1 hypothetical protein [Rhizobium sp. CFBP 13726]NSY19386.1 hypothetical protein [Neorhizobium sp. AL 9.2.2]
MTDEKRDVTGNEEAQAEGSPQGEHSPEREQTASDSKPHSSSPQTWSADHGGGVSPPTSKPVSSDDKAD